MKGESKHQLLDESYQWECSEEGCHAKVKSKDYEFVTEYIRFHHNVLDRPHHAGRLTITKVVETWK